MIKLNLNQALKGKGIENSNKFLKECGIPYYTASKLLHNDVKSIPFKYLEKICLKLHCTIDDLFVWIPDPQTELTHNHPLRKLVQKETSETLSQKIKELPFDKIQQLNNYIKSLHNTGQ